MNAFDRFADWVAEMVAHAGFFIFCALLVILWMPSIFIMPKHLPSQVDSWQLVINTVTTVITFLLVALLHNTQHRFEKAVNHRMECIEEELGIDDPIEDQGQKEKNT